MTPICAQASSFLPGTTWSTTLALWLGVSLGTVVLAYVLRSRWQKLSILQRCVILSLYAHALIVIVAVTTQMFTPPAVGSGGDASSLEVRVRLAPDVSPSEPAEIAPPPEPWDATPQEIADPATPPPLLTAAANELPAETMALAAPALLPSVPAPPLEVASEPQASPLDTVEQLVVAVAPRYAEDPTAALITSPIPPEPVQAQPTTPIQQVPNGAAHESPVHQVARAHVPAAYRQRFERKIAGGAQGATADSEAAVNAALLWLVRHQERDGRWNALRHEAGRGNPSLGHDRGDTGADADTGLTALAVLALLGAGHTHLEGEHREAVQHGLEFLLASQLPNGSLAGDAKLFASMYCHGMGTLAVCEALAITRDERLQNAARRAIAYTLAAQHSRGGWRYQPGDLGDMSQFGWQIMALRSAELAGLAVPNDTKERAKLFLAGASSGRAGGLAGYRAGERVTRTMTAEALVCRQLLYGSVAPATASEATEFVMEELPAAENTNVYYWYYGTLALRFAEGRQWDTWHQTMQRELIASQRRAGDVAGSWDPDRVWGSFGGRVYQTALSTLCLESYYRYDTAALQEIGGSAATLRR